MVALLIAFCCFLLYSKTVIPGIKNIFRSETVVIDTTPILIRQIKSIGQLITYTSYDEVVADSVIMSRDAALVNTFNRFAPLPLFPTANKQLVLIARGKILAGINLSSITSNSLRVKNDTVWIRLPNPQILDVILNPSDFETFVEKGDWSQQEVVLVKAKARRKMIERAVQQNLLQKAGSKAKTIMENFLQNIGYAHTVFL